MIVIKRDGREAVYDLNKISKAISSAVKDAYSNIDDNELSIKTNEIINLIEKEINKLKQDKISVEKIQDINEEILKKYDIKIKNVFSDYRSDRTHIRDMKSKLMNTISKIAVETDRDNANVGNNFSSKLLRIASESNKWCVLANMPKEMAKAHEVGDLHYHDLDSYNLTTNCLHVPTKKMLENGFNTGYGTINKPKRIETAAELSCILLQSSQNDMFGGQAHPDFDNDLGEYVEPTRQEIIQELIDLGIEPAEEIVEKKVKRSIHQAMQAIVYNLNTMHSRAGSQVPFSSVNIGIPKSKDAALVCEIFLEEYEKGLGKNEQPIFPNIIFRVADDCNRKPGTPYYYLYKLACRVASKRMNPTFMNMNCELYESIYKEGKEIPATMGCRTALGRDVNSNNEGIYAGRGNIAPATINLPRLGILANKNIDRFFELFDEKIDMCKQNLLHRYNVLKELKVKDLPFVCGQHLMLGSENLNPDDSIEPILKHGTYGIGFIGLAETLIALTGKHHGESQESYDLGYKIVKHLRDKCEEFKAETKLNWSCYATPAEGLSGRFTPMDKKIYGVIEGVTDHGYYTNSYHIPVDYQISIMDKLRLEGPFHTLCNGGTISYVEVDDYPDADTVELIVSTAFIQGDTAYMGINFVIRYCRDCGTYLYDEESCPHCNSKNIQGVSRVTGYLSLTERQGQGKVNERASRISHNREDNYVAYEVLDNKVKR